MSTLNPITLPDDLYKELQELAQAENGSIEAQVVRLLQNALQTKRQQTEEQRRNNILKVLEESRLRREQLPTDTEWPDSTALIREDRDR